MTLSIVSTKVICVSNFCDFNFHGCRHERIHTKKGSYMKSQSQTCDDVDDLATLEVLDEVRMNTDPTRERPKHTHTHTGFGHQYIDSGKTSGNFPSFCQTAHSFQLEFFVLLTFSSSIFQRDCQVTITHPSSLIF